MNHATIDTQAYREQLEALLKHKQAPLVKIHLEGELAEICQGSMHGMRARSTREAIEGLCANFPALKLHLYNSGEYAVLDVSGSTIEEALLKEDRYLIEEQLTQPIREFAIVPAIGGAGMGRFGRLLTGAALLGVGIWTGGSTLVYAGLAMAGGAVAEMLAPKPKTPATEGERDQSFLFNNSAGSAQDADPVPEAYGLVMCPLIVLNEDIDISDIPIGNA